MIPRGYKPKFIDVQIKRILDLAGSSYEEKRQEALKKKEKKKGNNKRVIVPFEYNPLLPKVSSILSKHYNTMTFNNPDLKGIFPEPPMAALRQGSNLRKYLCRSQLYIIIQRHTIPKKYQENSSRVEEVF